MLHYPKPSLLLRCALPALYDIVATQIQNLIAKDGLNVSFTTDTWTSDVSPVSMLSLMAQWLDQDFNMQKAMLHAQECPGSHTATIICQAFEIMLAQWSITMTKCMLCSGIMHKT